MGLLIMVFGKYGVVESRGTLVFLGSSLHAWHAPPLPHPLLLPQPHLTPSSPPPGSHLAPSPLLEVYHDNYGPNGFHDGIFFLFPAVFIVLQYR